MPLRLGTAAGSGELEDAYAPLPRSPAPHHPTVAERAALGPARALGRAFWGAAKGGGDEDVEAGAGSYVKRQAQPTGRALLFFVGGFLSCWALVTSPWPFPARIPSIWDFLGLGTPEDWYVDLSVGRVRGVMERVAGMETPTLGRSFYGVPYGMAGRFEAPQPARPWYPNVLDASRPGPSCLRPDAPGSSEDCLYLNVYTPMPAAADTEQAHPVLVWFHGGSFVFGSASDTLPRNVRELQLTNRLVVVIPEYRLGVLGFLGSQRLRRPWNASAGPGTTGNWGLLDQQLALRWVAQHIAHFGGDPERVGVVGWSAGAASVSAHLSMPSSRGLFGRAVMLSGGFTDWAAFPLSSAEETYEAVLQSTGCGKFAECWAPGAPCRCLLEIDGEVLVRVNPTGSWGPVVDGTALPLHPQDASRLGAVHAGVPVIIGSAIEDSLVDIGADATDRDFKEYLERLLDKATAEKAYALYMTPEYVAALGEAPNQASHAGWSPGYWAARRVYADFSVTCPARRAAMVWRNHTSAPAYWYLWDVGYPQAEDEAPSHGRRGSKLQVGHCYPCPGAGHGSDQAYLFQLDPGSVRGKAEALATTYPALIADFVREGDPNVWNGFHLSESEGNFKLAWPSAEAGSGMWFQANHSAAFDDLRSELCDFWDAQLA